MRNTFELCIDLNITEVCEVLSGYYGVTLRDEYLVEKVIIKSGQLLGEVIDGSICDTSARELLIRQVIKSLPDSEGMEWPTYGTSEDESVKFFEWFGKAIKSVGGTFEEDVH